MEILITLGMVILLVGSLVLLIIGFFKKNKGVIWLGVVLGLIDVILLAWLIL